MTRRLRSGWRTGEEPERGHALCSDEQKRLAGAGERMRVYVPYGQEWYGYLMRRLAERPANLTFFLRSLLSQK